MIMHLGTRGSVGGIQKHGNTMLNMRMNHLQLKIYCKGVTTLKNVLPCLYQV